jgi:iron complex outermembrane receptor protein
MPPPEGFQLLDAGITLKKGSKYELTLNGNNLLNTRFRNYLDRFRYFTPAMGRNIGLKLNINIHYHEKTHP